MTETTEKASSIIIGIMFVAIFLVVMLLALALIINSVNTAGSGIQGGSYTGGAVINETSAWINRTGDNLNILTTFPTSTYCSITTAYNYSSGLVINAGNYTVNSVACSWKNATNVEWNNVSASYTYQIYNASSIDLRNANTNIQNGVVGMVVNFFSLAPTIGTIFAVVILIAGIVILVIYVRKMNDKGTGEGYYG